MTSLQIFINVQADSVIPRYKPTHEDLTRASQLRLSGLGFGPGQLPWPWRGWHTQMPLPQQVTQASKRSLSLRPG